MKNLLNWERPTAVAVDYSRAPFLSLQQEVNRVMKEFYNMMQYPFAYPKDLETLVINPSIDMVEDDKYLKIEAEMPGMGEDDIKVSINNGILSIQGKKEISKKDEGKNYVRREIGYGSYERNIPLPDYVNVNEAKASFKKGMLWITLPKKADAENKRRDLKIEKAS